VLPGSAICSQSMDSLSDELLAQIMSYTSDSMRLRALPLVSRYSLCSDSQRAVDRDTVHLMLPACLPADGSMPSSESQQSPGGTYPHTSRWP